MIRQPVIRKQRRQRQTLRHGGAGSVQAYKGNVQLPQAEAGADALIQQIPGKEHVYLTVQQLRFLQRKGNRLLLKLALGLLPGFHPKGGVLEHLVKAGTQRPLPLFFSHHSGEGPQAGPSGHPIGAVGQLFRHKNRSFPPATETAGYRRESPRKGWTRRRRTQ